MREGAKFYFIGQRTFEHRERERGFNILLILNYFLIFLKSDKNLANKKKLKFKENNEISAL